MDGQVSHWESLITATSVQLLVQAQIFMLVLGLELTSSFLYRKYFTHWAISTAPQHCLKYYKNKMPSNAAKA